MLLTLLCRELAILLITLKLFYNACELSQPNLDLLMLLSESCLIEGKVFDVGRVIICTSTLGLLM